MHDFEEYADTPHVRARLLWRRDVERFGKDFIPNVAAYQISKMTGVSADQIERMSEMPWKPKYGSACNGCGMCCQASICASASVLLPKNQKGPCPFLRDAGDKYRCSLMEGEELTGAGDTHKDSHGVLDAMGCDSSDAYIDGEELTDQQINHFDAMFLERRNERKKRLMKSPVCA